MATVGEAITKNYHKHNDDWQRDHHGSTFSIDLMATLTILETIGIAYIDWLCVVSMCLFPGRSTATLSQVISVGPEVLQQKSCTQTACELC